MNETNPNVPIKILLVEDNPGDAFLIEDIFSEVKGSSFVLEKVDRLAAATERAARGDLDVVLLDLSLPDSHGFDTFTRLQSVAPTLPIVVLTGFDDQTTAMRAVREGAQDYLIKGQVDSNMLARQLRYAIERKRVQEEIRSLNAELEHRVEERTMELADANEALARANEELMTLDQMKSAFINVTSHELRTPVTIISGMVALLARQMPQDQQEICRAFASVQRAVERLTRLVARVCDIADAGEYECQLNIDECDMSQLISQIIQDVETFAIQRNLKIEKDIHESFPLVQMDREKIRDALLNLVMNAIKFTEDGGTIIIMAKHRDAETAEICVIDTGVGMGNQQQAHLFEKFFAGNDPLSHSSGEFEFGKRGIGLGLAIVKQFVELHGGKVRAISEAGKGSSFYFTLPLKQDQGEVCRISVAEKLHDTIGA